MSLGQACSWRTRVTCQNCPGTLGYLFIICTYYSQGVLQQDVCHDDYVSKLTSVAHRDRSHGRGNFNPIDQLHTFGLLTMFLFGALIRPFLSCQGVNNQPQHAPFLLQSSYLATCVSEPNLSGSTSFTQVHAGSCFDVTLSQIASTLSPHLFQKSSNGFSPTLHILPSFSYLFILSLLCSRHAYILVPSLSYGLQNRLHGGN